MPEQVVARDDDGVGGGGRDRVDVVEVRLEHVPLRLLAQELGRHRDLVREFVLMQIDEAQEGRAGPHHELLELLEELGQYRSWSAPVDAQRDEAIGRDEAYFTLVYPMPRELAPAVARMLEVYERVDEFTRGDRHLLTLPPSPASTTFRRWYLGEFVRQAAGEPPLPWSPS